MTDFSSSPALDAASSMLGAMGGAALASWLGGIALGKGFGISVPFLAAWLLMLAFLFFVKQVAGTAGSGWRGQ